MNCGEWTASNRADPLEHSSVCPCFEILFDMPTIDSSSRIAIIGVGGVFPGAPDLEAFWKNIENGIDSGRHVPPNRWFLTPDQALDPDGPRPDRVYSTWGCFIENFQFDPSSLNIDQKLLSHPRS